MCHLPVFVFVVDWISLLSCVCEDWPNNDSLNGLIKSNLRLGLYLEYDCEWLTWKCLCAYLLLSLLLVVVSLLYLFLSLLLWILSLLMTELCSLQVSWKDIVILKPFCECNVLLKVTDQYLVFVCSLCDVNDWQEVWLTSWKHLILRWHWGIQKLIENFVLRRPP